MLAGTCSSAHSTHVKYDFGLFSLYFWKTVLGVEAISQMLQGLAACRAASLAWRVEFTAARSSLLFRSG
jgi:hypothetical protein